VLVICNFPMQILTSAPAAISASSIP
jgi:hypothetical protein